MKNINSWTQSHHPKIEIMTATRGDRARGDTTSNWAPPTQGAESCKSSCARCCNAGQALYKFVACFISGATCLAAPTPSSDCGRGSRNHVAACTAPYQSDKQLDSVSEFWRSIFLRLACIKTRSTFDSTLAQSQMGVNIGGRKTVLRKHKRNARNNIWETREGRIYQSQRQISTAKKGGRD